MQNKFYSPLRYPGGKNCIFPFIASLLHENNLVGVHYAEPFAGGAGLALRLLYEGHVDDIYINDFDRVIYSFWSAAVNRCNELCDWVSDVRVTIDTWHEQKQIIKYAEQHDILEIAKATLFLNRTNVSGVLKGGIIGGKSQVGKDKIDARFNKKTLLEKLNLVSFHRKRIHVTNLDGIDFVNKLSKIEKNTFVYLDPPYYKKGRNMYLNFYRDNDHVELANAVKKLPMKWIMSYDHHNFILDLYRSQRCAIYNLYQRNSNRNGSEVIIAGDEITFDQSILLLNSAKILP